MPQNGIVFFTEFGMTMQAQSESKVVMDMLWEQLEGLTHPTWSELVQYLKLPRRMDLAEATAKDVLFSHAEQTARIQEVEELIQSCELLS